MRGSGAGAWIARPNGSERHGSRSGPRFRRRARITTRAATGINPPIASPISNVTPSGLDGGPGAATSTEIKAVRTIVRFPFAPVIVTVYDPAVVPMKVHVDVPLPLMLSGEHDTERPAGEELADNVTLPVKPPVGRSEIVAEPV